LQRRYLVVVKDICNKASKIIILLSRVFVLAILVSVITNMINTWVNGKNTHEKLLLSVLLESAKNKGDIVKIKEQIKDINRAPDRLLSNSMIKVAFSNPHFVEHSRCYNLILLMSISGRIDCCNSMLEYLRNNLSSENIRIKNNEELEKSLDKLDEVIFEYQARRININIVNAMEDELPYQQLSKLKKLGIVYSNKLFPPKNGGGN